MEQCMDRGPAAQLASNRAACPCSLTRFIAQRGASPPLPALQSSGGMAIRRRTNEQHEE